MTKQREKELLSLWRGKTNDDWTQEWRDELTPEELELAENRDGKFINEIAPMTRDSWGN